MCCRPRAKRTQCNNTLPLKQKQIQQSKLEAEARKEATIQNAEASAQAKVIDSKSETERKKFLAEAEADRIRLTAAACRAHAERGGNLETESAADQQDLGRETVGQLADHDSAGGWEVLHE